VPRACDALVQDIQHEFVQFIGMHPRISKISGMCSLHAFAKVLIRAVRKIRSIRDFDQIFI